jgi:hypothetical protein|tara:strand:+ start:717 stop:890 length:174 start_codon:yes stop_codon:yes gene_type:complete
MIIVKKEYLNISITGGSRLVLGDMNQDQLQDMKNRYGDKWFETEGSKKKKKKDDVEN